MGHDGGHSRDRGVRRGPATLTKVKSAKRTSSGPQADDLVTMFEVAYRRDRAANLIAPGDPGTDCFVTVFKRPVRRQSRIGMLRINRDP